MPDINKNTIRFQDNHEAIVVFPSLHEKAIDIVQALELKAYNAVILVLGGADNIDERLLPRLTQVFNRGIARAAAEANALIIDGGTQAGVMCLMGEGVASRGYKSQLIGVAPAHKIILPGSSEKGTPLEPNHTHFVLVDSNDWGGETAMMFQMAEALRHIPTEPAVNQNTTTSTGTLPLLAIVTGGGTHTKGEVLRAVRQNISIIITEGSGGIADEIADAWKKKDTLPEDPILAEIIADGNLHFHQLSNSVKGLERLIIRELGIDHVLTQAWETFADYDLNANIQQKRFEKLQMAIIYISVIGTALVIIQQVFAPRDKEGDLMTALLFNSQGNMTAQTFTWWLIRYLLILMPITLTVLVTAANRFKQGSKWLLLRAGAEAIKREIFRYRTRAMYYKEKPEFFLAKKLENITQRTMRTDVNISSLKPYNKEKGFPPDMYGAEGGDDGYSFLTPDRYVQIRLGDQLSYYRKKAVQREKQLKRLYWLTFVIGGIGTFLAAIGQQAWIALTTSIVSAFGIYLGFRQTENTLIKYNQAATDLSNVKSWWNALSLEEQSKQQNIDSLVAHTEKVLQSEMDGWIQQMQNALAELRKGQGVPVDHEEDKEPKEEIIETKPETESGRIKKKPLEYRANTTKKTEDIAVAPTVQFEEDTNPSNPIGLHE